MAFKRRFSQFLLFFLGMLVVVSIDQFLKYKIRQSGGFFVCNKGISFGIDAPFVVFGASLVFFAFILSICVYLYKKTPISSLLLLSLTFVGGGGASNILDRIFLGCVFDYMPLFSQKLPLFNVADVGIFIGTLLLVFILFYKNIDSDVNKL